MSNPFFFFSENLFIIIIRCTYRNLSLNYLNLINSTTYVLYFKKCQATLKYVVLASKCSAFPEST